MKHCRNLAFEEKPDYEKLINLLKGLAEKEGINIQDKVFDWVTKGLEKGTIKFEDEKIEDEKKEEVVVGNQEDSQKRKESQQVDQQPAPVQKDF